MASGIQSSLDPFLIHRSKVDNPSSSDSEDGYPTSTHSSSRLNSELVSDSESIRTSISGDSVSVSGVSPPCPRVSNSTGTVPTVDLNPTNDPSLPFPSSEREKQVRIRDGPYQPQLPNYRSTLHNGRKRCFLPRWYRSHNWLEYSPITDKMYCFICRAFGHTVPGTSGKLDTAFTTVGTQGQRWKKATTLLSKHQSSLVHKQSALSYAEFLTSIPINHQLDQASAKSSSRLQKQQETNREILHRIIDVILLLGHPLRGHRENNESHNRGLFLEITQLLAKYDGLLKAHFEDGPRNARYTSMTIQNDLISAIYHNMISLLKEEFSGIVYFSIMMDEASDLSHKEQVSIVVRYVDSQYVIQERLVDVESTDSTTAEALFQILLKGLSKVGLTTDNLVGQCYDGASNMRGIHAGVQVKVKEIQPRAIYCHCYAHCVNLVLVEATSSNQCCRNFFGVIQNLYTFIEASPHRHSTLVAFMKELSSKPHVKTLKKLSDTRWACRSDAVQAVYENFEAIMKSLEEIEDNCHDGRISAEACGLKFSILKFDYFSLSFCFERPTIQMSYCQ